MRNFFQVIGAHSINGTFIQRVSDLQFVLHHVEGVGREVDLLDAIDDLLLCLRVDGLLPQLPQLLLGKGKTTRERERERDRERDRQRQRERERIKTMSLK